VVFNGNLKQPHTPNPGRDKERTPTPPRTRSRRGPSAWARTGLESGQPFKSVSPGVGHRPDLPVPASQAETAASSGSSAVTRAARAQGSSLGPWAPASLRQDHTDTRCPLAGRGPGCGPAAGERTRVNGPRRPGGRNTPYDHVSPRRPGRSQGPGGPWRGSAGVYKVPRLCLWRVDQM
jgi:hypothetical protein